MKTVTSISGGKTSSMMAVEFPTDYYVFAVVLTDQIEAVPSDKGLLREFQNRIPEFKASRELDQTLINVLELEQLIGKRIDWVAAPFTFDELIHQTTDYPSFRSGQMMLPNKRARFCTVQLKLMPIFWHCFLNYYEENNPVLMNIGFRWDESQRVERWTCDNDKFKFPFACSTSGRKQWQYSSCEWRISHFPMYEAGISNPEVKEYWNNKNWIFPSVSNCDFCFHHRPIQQQIQSKLYPDRAKWWIAAEDQSGSSFNKERLENILQQSILGIYTEDNQSLCHCTD